MNIQQTECLDLKGLNCPLPVLRTRKYFRDKLPGTRVWIETTDPLAVVDIPNYCREDRHKLVEAQETAGVNRFLIERG